MQTETSDGSKGGTLKGKPHFNEDGSPAGGIKAVVTDSGKHVELEGDEVIINKHAARLHWQELSRINQSAGGGVAIAPPSGAKGKKKYSDGGNIPFNPNRVPKRQMINYAKTFRAQHPELWGKFSTEYGDKLFDKLCEVDARGYWHSTEQPVYEIWVENYENHRGASDMASSIFMLKWGEKLDIGFKSMKHLISGKDIAGRKITKESENLVVENVPDKTAETIEKTGAVPSSAKTEIAQNLPLDYRYIPAAGHARHIGAFDESGKRVAVATFAPNEDGTHSCINCYTEPLYRRGGIMSAIYDLAEQDMDIVPSERINVETKQLWLKRNPDIFLPKDEENHLQFSAGGNMDKPTEYNPVMWHLTLAEFLDYLKDNPVDLTTSSGNRFTPEEYYKYAVILPVVKNSDRNPLLLAVESGQLPYSKVKEIVTSAGAWDTAEPNIASLEEHEFQLNYSAKIWQLPKAVYLDSDYFRNNFTVPQKEKWYKGYIFHSAFLNDRELRELMGKGIVSYSDVHKRLKESDNLTDRKIIVRGLKKLRDYSFAQKAKNKLKILQYILESNNQKSKELTKNEYEESGAKSSTKKWAFLADIVTKFSDGESFNKTKLESLAGTFGLTDKNEVKEMAELAITMIARAIAHEPDTDRLQRYKRLEALYHGQVNMSHRTSDSMEMQQYSTPVPIAYVLGIFCKFDDEKLRFFEPSAGNGMLTIAGHTDQFTVNEIDTVRSENLRNQGFLKVMKQDGSYPFKMDKEFDGVITNPPFGKTYPVTIDGVKIDTLEHLMAIYALQTMKDDGRCAIIIGGHTTYDDKGRVQAGKNRTFFVWLYKHYNVRDVINISGRDLYSRQGTGFNTRAILVDGRKAAPHGFPPLITQEQDMDQVNSPKPVDNYDSLWTRVSRFF